MVAIGAFALGAAAMFIASRIHERYAERRHSMRVYSHNPFAGRDRT